MFQISSRTHLKLIHQYFPFSINLHDEIADGLLNLSGDSFPVFVNLLETTWRYIHVRESFKSHDYKVYASGWKHVVCHLPIADCIRDIFNGFPFVLKLAGHVLQMLPVISVSIL